MSNFKSNTIKISNVSCKKCGWSVLIACCNGLFRKFKDASDWDWWRYCSNKGCEHHEGQGVFQKFPDWAE